MHPPNDASRQVLQECANQGCKVRFAPQKPNHRYHNNKCRALASVQRREIDAVVGELENLSEWLNKRIDEIENEK